MSEETGTGTGRSEQATADGLVDALNGVFGRQASGRAVHAKGIVLEGRFLPGPAAATVSVAPHFRGSAVRVTARFSGFAGTATVSDTDPMASPRGLAIRFHLPDGSYTDLVTHSFNGFPSRTADEFRRLFVALGASGPGVPAPTPADLYLETHPIARAFLESQKPPPVSYATLPYYGVNSFKFTNAQARVRFGRYRIEPRAGEHYLTEAERAKAAPNYLADELHWRLALAPVAFDIRVQVAGLGDDIEDPSVAWPESRELIDLGALELSTAVFDNDAAERALLFMPAVLPAGIEPADPMILARSRAYPVSYERRHVRA